MRYSKLLLTITLTLLCGSYLYAQNPQGEQGSLNIEEIAAKEADNLMKEFDLDFRQVFLIDSLLQDMMPKMNEEMSAIQRAGVTNRDIFQITYDKWLDAIDKEYEKIFTEDQWKRYLKSARGREKRKRDKRMAERAISY
ncbi:MAG TPA: hypothetical protein PK979_02015 [Bacteroidales bacterium]|jgi:hypothetical protein|nr:hypothetical protein [Bacteroidales bacterium]